MELKGFIAMKYVITTCLAAATLLFSVQTQAQNFYGTNAREKPTCRQNPVCLYYVGKPGYLSNSTASEASRSRYEVLTEKVRKNETFHQRDAYSRGAFPSAGSGNAPGRLMAID